MQRAHAKRLQLLAIVVPAVATAVLLSTQPASALVCANDWGGDPIQGAREAVSNPDRWDGLLVGNVSAIEHKNDYWQTPVLVVEPEVVFAGAFRGAVHVEIGSFGPDTLFDTGRHYFMALERSSSLAAFIVDPCAPNMEVNSADQLAKLRAASASEVVITMPDLASPRLGPWVAAAAVVALLIGLWLARRRRAQ